MAGCGSRDTPVQQADRAQTLLVGNLSEPPDLDPQRVNDTQTQNIMEALFEGLTQYDPKTCEPTPGVATSWEVSADELTWTFHLRPEAKWSNGDPVTAGDFVFAYRRILHPRFAAEYAYFLYALKHGQAFAEGRITDPAQIGARAADAHTLVLSLEHPVPYLPAQTCHPAWYPLHPATILKFGKIDDRGTAWTRPGNLVGNGPFTLVAWEPRRVVRCRRSETYWNRAEIRLNQVDFLPIENADTEEHAFRAGQLHVTSEVPPEKVAVYEKNAPTLISESPYFSSGFYRFNTTRPPLNDVRVRRALAISFDRGRIVRDVLRGHQTPAFHLTPPGIPGFDPQVRLNTDVAEARRLLAAAGYPGGKGFPPIDILINTNQAHQQVAEAIQRMWNDNLGIHTAVLNQEATVWNSTMQRLDYTIARFAWTGDYLDPSTFLDILRSDSGNNCTGWKNAEYDRLIREANSTADRKRRYACYQRCEEIIAEECPIAPIYNYVRLVLIRPELKGWHPNLLDLHPFTGVELERPGS